MTESPEPPVQPEPPEPPVQPPFLPVEYEAGAARWVGRATHELGLLQHPILAQFRHEAIDDLAEHVEASRPDPAAEGPGENGADTSGPSAENVDASPLASPLFQPIVPRHELLLTVAEVVAFDVDQLLANIYELSDALAGQLVAGMFAHLSQVCDDNGQTVDGSGRDLFDSLNDAVESMEFGFDENGEHDLFIALHPDVLAKIMQKEPTPEQVRRAAEIMERKREVWRASQRRRDLP